MNRSRIVKDLNFFDLLKGGAIAMFFKIVGVLAGYAFFWLLARYYGAAGVGLFQTIWTVLMISAVVAKLGFDTSIVKFVGVYKAKGKDVFIRNLYKRIQKWLLLSSMVVALILIVFSLPLSELFFETPDNQNLLIYAAVSLVPLVLLNYNAETFKSLKHILPFAIFQNGTIYLFTGLLIIVFFHLNYGFTSTMWSLTATLIILLLISHIWLYRKLPVSSSKKYETLYTNKELFKITVPMLLSNSLFLLMNWTDTIMLSAFLPEDKVGIYATALKIAALNSVILVAVNSIAMPKFAELFEKKSTDQFRKFVKQSTLLMFTASLPVLIIIFIFPGWLLSIFGKEFIVGEHVLLILAFGQFFSTISGSVINILNMGNHQIQARNILGISTLVNIILNLILIPIMGILGAAIATTTSTIIWNLMAVIVIYRKFGFVTYPFIKITKDKKTF